jgi:hypothetical protein
MREIGPTAIAMIRSSAILLSFLLPTVTQAQIQSEVPPPALYRCVTTDVIGFNHDPEWFEDRRQNTYELLVNGDEVLVFRTASDGSKRSYRYTVSEVSLMGVITKDTTVRNTILILPLQLENDLEELGYFEVTLSEQGNFFINAWLLRCVK